MTPQQKLREMRNKVIPPVLERGCERIFKNRPSGTPFVYCPNCSIKKIEGEPMQILGKPVSSFDLLTMLKIKGDWSITTDGDLLNYEEEQMTVIDISKGDNIELQDEEVLNKLIEILS